MKKIQISFILFLIMLLPTMVGAATKYSCPSGYTLSGSKCIKTTKAYWQHGAYYCNPGTGTLKGKDCELVINATATEVEDSEVEENKTECPEGYQVHGTNCIKYSSSAYQTSGQYYCKDGLLLVGTACYTSIDAEELKNKLEGTPDPDVGDDPNLGTIQKGCEVIPEVVRKWINNILKFVRYVALALVIALGALAFMKAAGDGEPDAMKKAGQAFMKRMIAVVILFLLPVIVDFILNMVNIYGVDTNNIDCMKNLNQ